MRRLRKRKLEERIQREVDKIEDSLDPDIIPYISALIENIASLTPMDHMDLTTPEGALLAISRLKVHEEELKTQTTALEALKRLILQRAPDTVN